MTALLLTLLLAAPEVAATTDDAAAPAPKKLEKLVFLGLQPGGGVSEEAAKALSESVQSELTKLGAYSVLSTSDLSTMLGIERQKQLMGCSESSVSCMAELAGALNSKRAITGNVTRIDAEVILNVSLIDPQNAAPIARVARRISVGASLAPVYDALSDVVYELVNQDPLFKDQPFSKPRGFGGFSLGIRGEIEALLPSVSPVVYAEYDWRYFGLALSVIATTNPGGRSRRASTHSRSGKLRPHIGIGATALIRSASVAVRGSVGLTLGLGHSDLARRRLRAVSREGRGLCAQRPAHRRGPRVPVLATLSRPRVSAP